MKDDSLFMHWLYFCGSCWALWGIRFRQIDAMDEVVRLNEGEPE